MFWIFNHNWTLFTVETHYLIVAESFWLESHTYTIKSFTSHSLPFHLPVNTGHCEKIHKSTTQPQLTIFCVFINARISIILSLSRIFQESKHYGKLFLLTDHLCQQFGNVVKPFFCGLYAWLYLYFMVYFPCHANRIMLTRTPYKVIISRLLFPGRRTAHNFSMNQMNSWIGTRSSSYPCC